MSSQTTTRGSQTRVDRLLSVVERAGNRLPEPFILFVLLFLVVALVSTVMSWAGVQVQLPGSDEVTEVRGLFTSEGLVWLTTTLGANFIEFPPLVTVLTILLGVALAEHSGLLAAGIRRLFGSAPGWALPYAVGFVGVSGSVMADSSFVVIPPLAAMVFKAAGRHPVAGLVGGFAAVGAGYSTSVFVTSLDALFAGITNAVTAGLPDPGAPVNPLSNYFFNVVSAIVLSLIAGWIIARVLEPRLVRLDVPTEQIEDEESAPVHPAGGVALDATERSALRWALLAGFLTAALMVVAVVLPGSPWRNEDGGYLPESPLLDSIVFIVFVMFAVPGIVYGFRAGTFTQASDVPRVMGAMIKSMSGFIVLAFILGQFTALFDWSGVGAWLAVSGADAVEAIGLPAFAAILCFVLLASCLNLFIVSGSAMWTLMAAVFVPMFALLGIEPAFVQAAFRVGDSATQIITPLNPYLIVLLTMVRRYEPEAGFGTLISRLLPFVVPFWVAWVLVLTVFYVGDIPPGPGAGIHLGD